jgi:hypothetical protein
MPTLVSDLTAWREPVRPVRIGPAAPETIILRELYTTEGYERVTAGFSGLDLTRRSIQLTPLHLANWALMELLARPLFFDKVWITAGDSQLGFGLGSTGDPLHLWFAPGVRVGARPGPSAVGTRIGELLAPVTETVTRCSRIHERAVATVAAESAIAGLFRTARSAGHPDDRDWLEQASTAVAGALGARVTDERLYCRPDDGPPVVIPSRSLCCVLHDDTSCHGCPGCPKTGGASEQARDVTAWIAAMGDDEFLDVTGRPKLGSGGTEIGWRDR